MKLNEKIGIGLVTIGFITIAVIVGFGTRTNNEGFKGSLVDAPAFLNVATSGKMMISSSEQVLATSSRKYAIVCNDSSDTIYLNLDGDKPATGLELGLRLNANGGCYEINSDNLYVGAVQATSTGSNSSILITEFK